jgi:CP family cyanate transporter-like MFS transporter
VSTIGVPPAAEVLRRRPMAPLVALLAVALSMRGPLTAVSTVLSPVTAGLGLPGWAPSVLNTLPTLCLGGFAFLGPGILRRVGDYRLVAWCLLAIVAGDILRLTAGTAAFFGGTILVAAAIGLANVAAPVLIKSWFPGRESPVTAAYAGVMAVGAAAAAALSARIAGPPQPHLNHWVTALGATTVPVGVISLSAWLVTARRPGDPLARNQRGERPTPQAGRGKLWRDPAAWSVTAYFGATTLLAYFVLGWLPTIVADQGTVSDGALLFAMSTLMQVAGTLTAPLLSQRLPDPRPLGCLAACVTGLGLVGVTLGSSAGVVWVSALALGYAQGAAFAFALLLITLRSPDAATASAMSAMAQGTGYLIGCFGPLGAGVLHAATGSWTIPLVGLVVVAAGQAAAGATPR